MTHTRHPPLRGIRYFVRLRRLQEENLRLKKELREAAYQSVSRELARSVFHNVGNVINSIGIRLKHLSKGFDKIKVTSFEKVMGLITSNLHALGTYLESDPKGKLVLPYMNDLVTSSKKAIDLLQEDCQFITDKINVITRMLSLQQAYATFGSKTEMVNVGQLWRDILEMFSGSIAKREIDIKLSIDEIPTIKGQKGMLILILIHILRNAIEAVDTMPIEKNRRIIIACAHDHSENKNELVIEVHDNGSGIKADDLPHIFESGFSTKLEKGNKGKGLTMCQEIIHNLKGSIDIHSDGQNQGAHVSIRFPMGDST